MRGLGSLNRWDGTVLEALEGRVGVRNLSCPSCLQIRQALELRLGHPLQQYRDFIDNQMLLLMAQRDRASRIFPHLYLVSCRVKAGAGQLQPVRAGEE